MRLRKALGAAGALLGSVAAAFALGTPAAQADTVTGGTAPALRFVSYNMCGSGSPCTDELGYTDAAKYATILDQTNPSVWGADQIFLQEVCRYQYDKLAGDLAPKGFEGLYTTTVQLGTASKLCAKGPEGTKGDYGMALFVKGTVSERKVLDLTAGGESEPIKAPCVKSYTQGRANWACSVHLYWASDPTLRNKEAEFLAAQAAAWQEQGLPVVLGGDFNDTPGSTMAGTFYEPGNGSGKGRFVEADETDKDWFTSACTAAGATRCRSGETTFGASRRKIDYIFLSGAHFKNVKGDVLPRVVDASDHDMVRAAATWADCGPAGATDGLFRRDASGALHRYAGRADGKIAAPCKVGVGWGTMSKVAQDGTTLVAVDGSGTLWRYPADPATGSYSGSTRVQAGTGWQGNDVLLAPGDFDGDGKRDLIGRDSAGALWLYPGDGANGYGAREQIGSGWQTFDSLLAPGDFDGDGRADLIGRDASGGLWFYKGDGAGYYAPRTQIGSGWQIYTALAAPGDINGDGRADLIGRDASGGLWFYKGDGAGYYAPRTQIGYSYPTGELLF
ncbi:FG-GAP-like repeat-containing protein [Streptomyces sp. NPDC014861]|uniref:FG-GAP-like repeat-containing protein n=1 Tax=Streptomyces sp. NPDC014861 TaxID=3364923 RepID=UPI0036FBB023